MSLSHAIALADSVRQKIDCAGEDPQNRAANAAEVAAGEVERKKARALLTSSIAAVEQTLSALRKSSSPKRTTSRHPVQCPQTTFRPSHVKGVFTVATHSARVAPVATTSNDPALDSVIQEMSADGLKSNTESLTDMANAIRPIIDKFDTVLKTPNLDSFNATVNTVPVVGIKGDNIMYIEAKPSITSGGSLGYAWSFFSALPPDVKISTTDNVHFFPYKGDFYLSVGKAVWKKAHINEKDPAIQQAVDNWPALYVKDWTAVGTEVLPASDLAALVPFAVLSADRTQIAFQLVALSPDGSFSFLTSDTLAPGAQFETLHYKTSSGSPATPPKFVKAAYWDNQIVAIDDASNIWNVKPNWDNGTYTISDKAELDYTTEFTANDVGPVSLRSDGYLWQRYVQPPPEGTKDDASLQWKRWIKLDGVANLGVASPGVILDMRLLTNTLRSRYVDVQTSVYPVVNMLRAFGLTHTVYLNSVSADAKAYANATSDEQRTLAIQNARKFVVHAQTWSKIVSGTISGVKESVNLMTDQLHDVRVQLEQQLQLLKDKLKGLQATLNVQEEQLSELRAAFWGTVAAMFLGVILVVAGAVMENPYLIVGGGLLFVGGLAATIYLAVQMAELASSIESTKAQIRDVTTAITELTLVVNNFQDLDDMYGELNKFWGRMANDASSIKTMDDVTAAQIGANMLLDTSSIEASQDMTSKLTEACQTYLDVLNEQGIQIPDSDALAVSRSAVMDSKRFNTLLYQARQAIAQRETEVYIRIMREAGVAYLAVQAQSFKAEVVTGLWFDIPALSSSASIWMNGSRAFTGYVDFPSAIRSTADSLVRALATLADSMDGALDEVRPYVRQMLTEIIGLGETIQGWTKQYPTVPTSPDDIAAMQKLQMKAVQSCESAQNKARLANNQFAHFTTEAREYQQGLDCQIQSARDEMDRKSAAAAEEIRNLSPPWYVYFGGAAAVLIWLAVEEDNIRSRLRSDLSSLNSSISLFQQMQQSGIEFNGKAQTWIDMSQTVSKNLGGVYNILSGVWGQLLEDPLLYADFMQTEWDQIVSNARDVLQILDGASRAMSFVAVPSRVITNEDKDFVIQAVSPASGLGSGINAQATSAEQVLTKLDILLTSPYLKDIIGYWDVAKTERHTLFDVVTGLKTEYVQMIGMEYEAIQNIRSLAILQEYRARNVAEGQLPLANFVQSTSQSVLGVLSVAQRTSAKFGDAASRFEELLIVIDHNVDDIVKTIGDLTDKIDQLEPQIRDKIISVIADAIALAFAAVGILLAFGIVGPVAAAVTLAAQIGSVATATAASIKLVLDSLSLADLVKTVESLKALRSSLTTSVDELKTVRPLFSDVVNGVNVLTNTIIDMQNTLNKVLNNLDTIGSIMFTPKDANKIKDAWATVGEDAQAWMDVANAQGISPITLSIKSAAA